MQINLPYRSKNIVRWSIITTLFLVAVVTLWVFNTETDGSKIPPEVIRPVKTIRISEKALTEQRSFPGLVKPLRETKLAFRVGGPLVALNIMIGQQVEKDQIIARIDPRDFEVNIKRLEAVLKQAQANLKALTSGARREDIARLKAQLNAAKAQLTTAENDFIRQKNLLAGRAASKANYDAAERAYELAKANLESVTQELKKAQSGGREEEIEAAQAGIKKLTTDLKAAKNALRDTELRAPFNGYISGQFVETYENVRPGEPVVALIDLSKVEVHTTVSEDIVVRRAHISRIEATLSAYPDQRFDAAVREIGRKTDSANQSYPFTVVLNIPEDLVIAPGMAATLTVSMANSSKQSKGYLLPSQSIFADPQGNTCVWRIDNEKMKTVKTKVTIGPLNHGTVQVLSGLNAKDQVVTAGAKFLRENQKVRLLK